MGQTKKTSQRKGASSRPSARKSVSSSKKSSSARTSQGLRKSSTSAGTKARKAAAKPSSSKRAGKKTTARFVLLGAMVAAVVAVAIVAGGVLKTCSAEKPINRPEGIPGYITDEMLVAAHDMQEQYGHPAGCTIAQIIQESAHNGSLSRLATQDNNLFGMKWHSTFSGVPGVVGPSNWHTNEEYDGSTVEIKDNFVKFESHRACIEFRSSVFLQTSTYAKNPTMVRAMETRNSALMAWGLMDAGWATDSSYAERLVELMSQYDLYRLDSWDPYGA